MKISYEQFLTESNDFKQSLVVYAESKSFTEDYRETIYQIIEAINEKSKTDKKYRNEAYKYFTCVNGYKTIKLRNICKEVGFDYWAYRNTELSYVNAINTIDTASIHHEINRYKRTFTLQKLTAYQIKDGDVYLRKNYRGITAENFVNTYYKEKGYNLTMTQLYRVNFKDTEMCTTWVHADINPIMVDILAIELNYRYVAIIADLSDAAMPISLDFREERSMVVTPVYNNYDWIKKADYYQLQAICDTVAELFEDSKNELLALKPKDK